MPRMTIPSSHAANRDGTNGGREWTCAQRRTNLVTQWESTTTVDGTGMPLMMGTGVQSQPKSVAGNSGSWCATAMLAGMWGGASWIASRLDTPLAIV